MKAEIIAVGTELLLGQIVNTNAQYLSQQLAQIGIDLYYQTVVGDNPERLLAAFEIAAKRADLIICTGGIGPTQDDLTKDILAQFTDDILVDHQPSLDKLHQVFHQRNMPMVESNLRQASMLKRSDALFNEAGLAVGIALEHNSCYFILLPGPPREMQTMFDRHAKPWITKRQKNSDALYSKVLKFSGIGESQLEHKLSNLISEQQEVTMAPYAKAGEVALRLSVKAQSEQKASDRLASSIDAVKKKVGQFIFAEEDIPLEQAVVHLLREQQLTLTVAESCSGGLLSELMTSIPGSSEVFRGGVITYTNDMKMKLLGVPAHLLEEATSPGAVSKQTAEAMATGALELTDSTYAISITGVAGPDRSEHKEVGLVYIALARRGDKTMVHRFQFNGTRELIRVRAAKQALHLLVKQLIHT